MLIVYLQSKGHFPILYHFRLELRLFLFIDATVAESEEASDRRVDQAFKNSSPNLLVVHYMDQEVDECLLSRLVLHGVDGTADQKLG